MMIQILHGFFSYLGTTSGELLKTAIELMLFVIVTYMIMSEYSRSPKKELRFLIIAFSALAVSKLITSYFLAEIVFAGLSLSTYTVKALSSVLEVLAFFLVANAFAYPIIKQRKERTKEFMVKRLALIIPASFALTAASSILTTENWLFQIADIAIITIAAYYCFFILANEKSSVPYWPNIIIALGLFSFESIFELINILFYHNTNSYISVASHPWPFLSILLFTQVVFLKMADKAALKSRLKNTIKEYEHEKEICKLKDEFISTVSHELKTPLTSMKLYTCLLKEGKLKGKKENEALDIINAETDRLNKMITEMLDLSRLESGKAKLNLEEFGVNELFKDGLYANTAKEKAIKLSIKTSKDAKVVADRDKIKQVFINLLNNSVKYTPAGGKIWVEAEIQTDAWTLTVRDTGIGIDKEKLPRIFEKFYQAENFMTRTVGGVGLGLAIVKQIVDLHKGEISVKSEAGKGTEISIRFPKLQIEK